jgi:hypothetical protein
MDSDFSQNTTNASGIDVGIIKQPQRSEWRVWLMGDYGQNQHGAIVYQPIKGQEPNWFHRKMQELCFGFQWRKVP